MKIGKKHISVLILLSILIISSLVLVYYVYYITHMTSLTRKSETQNLKSKAQPAESTESTEPKNLKQFLMDNSISYEVKPHDSLASIAKQFKTTPELIMQVNKIKEVGARHAASLLKRGMTLKVPPSKFQIDVDISNKTLLLKSGSQLLKKYDITTGAIQTPTPMGNFKIINKMKNPAWHSPKGIVAPNNPQNELGSRWMGIESQEIPKSRGFGIHGTIRPEAIGKADSTGCIRMLNSDVEELFDLLVVGTPVTIKK
jgi:lipoprotein-anchoring transpeptidase ErfK/SrfK